MTLLAIDTETTGVDWHHGARPFLVTTCDDEGNQAYWEWDVDPETRQPIIPEGDLQAISDLIFGAVGEQNGVLQSIHSEEQLILQNCKFDIAMLSTILPEFSWPWYRTQDTLIASHVLFSSELHNLTFLVKKYLDEDIEPYEDKVKELTTEAKRFARKEFPWWRLAKENQPDMPSIKSGSKRQEDKPWKNDMWLCRTIARVLGLSENHSYQTVTRDYANTDSAVLPPLWLELERMLKEAGLWKIYRRKMETLPAIMRMEARGVTCLVDKSVELKSSFNRTVEICEKKCIELSDGKLTEMPSGSRSKQMEDTIFNHFDLSSSRLTKAGNQSMDKYAREDWLNLLDPDEPAWQFLNHQEFYTKRMTSLGYIRSYERFWLPIPSLNGQAGQYRILYPTYNPTGTKLTRGSMSNPNGQQISKQNLVKFGSDRKDKNAQKEKNVRHMFGPAPGREWWSMDGENLEMRLPAFEANEPDLVWLFTHPKDPPYYGSYHLMVCDILHPELFAEYGKAFKTEFEDSWYQRTKNGNFSIQYGCQRAKADLTFGVPGAFDKLGQRFPRITALRERLKAEANRTGRVKTIPNKFVDPTTGYSLICQMTEDGYVMPTNPLSYHIQGTAGEWICNAMIECDQQFVGWLREEEFNAGIVLQVHDELVFDMPRGVGSEPWKTNLPRARKLQALMEKGGEGIGVPTPVSVEWHGETWAVGKSL